MNALGEQFSLKSIFLQRMSKITRMISSPTGNGIEMNELLRTTSFETQHHIENIPRTST